MSDPPATSQADSARRQVSSASSRSERLTKSATQPRAAAILDGAALVTASAVVTLAFSSAQTGFLLSEVLFCGLVFAQLAIRGAYATRIRHESLEDIRVVVPATAVAAMSTLGLLVIVSAAIPTARLAALWVVAAVYVVAARAGSRVAAVRRAKRHGLGAPTLIIGAGRVGRTVAARLLASPGIGLRPIGFLDKEPLGEEPPELPVLGASWDLEQVVESYGVTNVIITFSTAPTSVILSVIRQCERLGVTVSSIPRLYESVNGRLTLEHFGGIPVLTKRPANPRGWQFRCKYGVDRLLATSLVILILPVLLTVALAVRLSMGRPILFRQVRIGRDGKPFEMLKFRSMSGREPTGDELGNETAVGPGGVEGADRRTWVGKLIRQMSLDELPQLLNVMRGDMSLVGPRPERPGFVALFEEHIHRYSDRHRVKGGITGWAQINGLRGRTSLEDRVEWDNYYIDNWSPWLDVKTLVLTAVIVLRGYHAPE